MDDDAHYRQLMDRATRLGTLGSGLAVVVGLVLLVVARLFDLTVGQAVLLAVPSVTIVSVALVVYAIRNGTRRRRQREEMRHATSSARRGEL